MTGCRRIVFLGHAADRTGPPVYLLQLLRHLDRRDLDLHVVLLRGGELLADLRALADVHVVGEPADEALATEQRRAEEPHRIDARRAQLAHLLGTDLVVVNTAWSIHALAWLPDDHGPVLSIVHELSAGVDLLGPEALDSLLRSDRFVVGCGPVADLLQGVHGVAPDRIDLIPYGVDLGPLQGTEAPTASRRHFTVASAAVPDRRKGPDLFVHLAGAASRRHPDVDWSFRWIGAEAGDPRLAEALLDRTLLGIEDLVCFDPPVADLRDQLASADAFVLCSRQDAFPLVAIEAALARLPLACFDTGGMPDLVGDDGGRVVPYGDLDGLADELAAWYHDPGRRQAMGRAAQHRARRDHDVVDHARRFRTSMDRLLGLA